MERVGRAPACGNRFWPLGVGLSPGVEFLKPLSGERLELALIVVDHRIDDLLAEVVNDDDTHYTLCLRSDCLHRMGERGRVDG